MHIPENVFVNSHNLTANKIISGKIYNKRDNIRKTARIFTLRVKC